MSRARQKKIYLELRAHELLSPSVLDNGTSSHVHWYARKHFLMASLASF